MRRGARRNRRARRAIALAVTAGALMLAPGVQAGELTYYRGSPGSTVTPVMQPTLSYSESVGELNDVELSGNVREEVTIVERGAAVFAPGASLQNAALDFCRFGVSRATCVVEPGYYRFHAVSVFLGPGDDRGDARRVAPELINPAVHMLFLYGREGDDALVGSGGPDYLEGGSETDKLDGNGGDDELKAEDGPPATPALAPGPDQVRGGTGDDHIFVRDGARDQVNCGDGADRVHADPVDVLRDCETVLDF